ncbi:large ribonuclease reductase [Human betaherpesvirus 6B]|uniref:Ribonucleotide reductase large subunit domain-containing protein n=3 Tax=root TaxID=1 RepID=A0A703YB53_SALER|nr:ribonucleotide reductase subunit 1 [Human betaherpesvirus 6B]ARJ98828.1 U28 [Human betaherpesvirus 6]HAC7784392.1 hypothetical protein [Salmonella enterica]APO37210.1 ribonucleotide reductase subunit 1 [Human betaherpesvirus 6B]APO37554.1 ribonucleotide reductase subunit 1 [Human betaherpesvirus 6B]
MKRKERRINKDFGYNRKCVCHYEASQKRFCYSQYSCASVLYERVRDIAKIMDRLDSGLDAWCLRDAIISVLRATHCVPRVDRMLGRWYLKTSIFYDFCPDDLILSCPNVIMPNVLNFVKKYRDFIRSVLYKVSVSWKNQYMPGVLGASRFLEEISNSLNGVEESIPCIYLRMCATLTEIVLRNGYLREIYQENPYVIFEELAFSLFTQKWVLPFSCMTNLGLVEKANSTVFDVAIYNTCLYSLADFITVNGEHLFPALLNGSNISMNVTRYQQEAKNIFEILLSQIQVVERDTDKTVQLTVYVEVWHVSALTWLDLYQVLPETSRVTFCLIIPGIFMDRYELKRAQWSLFHKNIAFELGKCDEVTFSTKYLEFERTTDHAKITMASFVEKICRCLKRGRMGLIFRKNVYQYSMIPHVPLYCGGDFLDVLPVRDGINTCLRMLLNVVHFLGDEVSDELTEEIDFVRLQCKFFMFNELRRVVRKMVLVANAVIDYAVENKDFLREGIVDGRSLGICITGLHSVFMTVGLSYAHPDACRLYRMMCEHIYYTCVRTSVDCCMKGAEPCNLFDRSKYALGMLYFDQFDNVECTLPEELWTTLRKDVLMHGVRNIHFTAGTAMQKEFDIINSSESFWPMEDNKILRRSNIKVVIGKDGLNDVTSVYSSELKSLYIPVYNNLLLNRFNKHQQYLKTVGYRVLNVDTNLFTDKELDDLAVFKDGFSYPLNDLIEMYKSGLPFLDQGQANVFYFNDTVSLKHLLPLLYKTGFKVAMYKVLCSSEMYKHLDLSNPLPLIGKCSDGVVMHVKNIL